VKNIGNTQTGNRQTRTENMFIDKTQKHAQDPFANDTKARADYSIHSNHFCM